MDEDLVSALRARGADVVTALEKGMIRRRDDEHLQIATEDGRVLFSFNRGDFHKLHTRYLTEGKRHVGSFLLISNSTLSVKQCEGFFFLRIRKPRVIWKTVLNS